MPGQPSAEHTVTFWDIEHWMAQHPVYLSIPDDIIARVLEDRGIGRERIASVYPGPIAAAPAYIVLVRGETDTRIDLIDADSWRMESEEKDDAGRTIRVVRRIIYTPDGRPFVEITRTPA